MKEQSLLSPLAILLAMNCLDAVSTFFAVSHGGMYEANVFMQSLIDGPPKWVLFFAYKFLFIPTLLLIVQNLVDVSRDKVKYYWSLSLNILCLVYAVLMVWHAVSWVSILH